MRVFTLAKTAIGDHIFAGLQPSIMRHTGVATLGNYRIIANEHARIPFIQNRELACAASPHAAAASASGLKLIVYSKEGCHLCEGLKEKLEALIQRAGFMPSILSGASLEERDIETNPEWQAAYAMTIPVLVVADADGKNEREIPRASPRLAADALEKHIAKHLTTSA